LTSSQNGFASLVYQVFLLGYALSLLNHFLKELAKAFCCSAIAGANIERFLFRTNLFKVFFFLFFGRKTKIENLLKSYPYQSRLYRIIYPQ